MRLAFALLHTAQHALVLLSAEGPANALRVGHFESFLDQGLESLPLFTVRPRDLPLENFDVSTAFASHALSVCDELLSALLVSPASFATLVLSTAFSVLEAFPQPNDTPLALVNHLLATGGFAPALPEPNQPGSALGLLHATFFSDDLSLALGIAHAASHPNDSSLTLTIAETLFHSFVYGHFTLAPGALHATLHPLKAFSAFPVLLTPFLFIYLSASNLVYLDRSYFKLAQ